MGRRQLNRPAKPLGFYRGTPRLDRKSVGRPAVPTRAHLCFRESARVRNSALESVDQN